MTANELRREGARRGRPQTQAQRSFARRVRKAMRLCRKTYLQVAAECDVNRMTAWNWAFRGLQPKQHHMVRLLKSVGQTERGFYSL
jgi:hypothetical protein